MTIFDNSQSAPNEADAPVVTANGFTNQAPQTPADAFADTVSLVATAAPAETDPVETVAEPAVVVDATSPTEGDDENVARLKELLIILKKGLSKKSDNPVDFEEAAKVNSQITKLIIRFPKPALLDVYVAFLTENADGVASRMKFMLGSTRLGSSDEREIGTLYTLFMDVVEKNPVRINRGEVQRILTKTEILTYYRRKIDVLTQQRRNSDA